MNNITGRVWKFEDNINTDLMYPQICYTLPENDKPFYAMHANRPEWARMVNKGDIIAAGKNFGTGSSRPAADNLKNLGIACVLAESINGLFMRNSVNSGLISLEVPGITGMADEGDTLRINFNGNYIENISNGKIVKFRPLPEFLMEIIDAGGIINILKNKGLLGEPL
ncbi:3-isopropylmalate dehydratase [Acidiplasma sp.]|uniref:LeuD/DmdB family oxidoreductase small subunit n=1 Tax=Acidiplasma sp. TaxID=1872114 RepID=UPI00258798C6|nr:3-isopropylmalate dehydratase [Acidiplasma sp.]